MGNVDRILEEYDRDIDYLVEDAKGVHDTVKAMKRDIYLENSGMSQEEVSQIARDVDEQADEDEELSYDDLEEIPEPTQKRVKVIVVVPPCRRRSFIEAVQKDRIVARCAVKPSRKPQKVSIGVPQGVTEFRMSRILVSRKVNATKPGRLRLGR